MRMPSEAWKGVRDRRDISHLRLRRGVVFVIRDLRQGGRRGHRSEEAAYG